MTVEELRAYLGCETVSGCLALKNEVKSGYCGDLLSWVMGRAEEGSAWVTVMGNVNAVAVAVLASSACMVLAEGASLDTDAMKKAVENDVAVLKSNKTTFEIAALVHEALK